MDTDRDTVIWIHPNRKILYTLMIVMGVVSISIFFTIPWLQHAITQSALEKSKDVTDVAKALMPIFVIVSIMGTIGLSGSYLFYYLGRFSLGIRDNILRIQRSDGSYVEDTFENIVVGNNYFFIQGKGIQFKSTKSHSGFSIFPDALMQQYFYPRIENNPRLGMWQTWKKLLACRHPGAIIITSWIPAFIFMFLYIELSGIK